MGSQKSTDSFPGTLHNVRNWCYCWSRESCNYHQNFPNYILQIIWHIIRLCTVDVASQNMTWNTQCNEYRATESYVGKSYRKVLSVAHRIRSFWTKAAYFETTYEGVVLGEDADDSKLFVDNGKYWDSTSQENIKRIHQRRVTRDLFAYIIRHWQQQQNLFSEKPENSRAKKDDLRFEDMTNNI